MSFSKVARRQEKEDEKEYKRNVKEFIADTKERKKSGYIQTRAEMQDTESRLMSLARQAENIKRVSGNTKGTREAYSLYNKAAKSEYNYRQATDNKMRVGVTDRYSGTSKTADNMSAASSIPKTGSFLGGNDPRANMQRGINAADRAAYDRFTKQQKERSELESLSAKDLKYRIDEIDKRQKQLADRKGYISNSTQRKPNLSNADVANMKNELAKLDKEYEALENEKSKYKTELPNAAARAEESKLSDAEKNTLELYTNLKRSTRNNIDNGLVDTAISAVSNIAGMGLGVAPATEAVKAWQGEKDVKNEEKYQKEFDRMREKGIDVDYLLQYYKTKKDNEEQEQINRFNKQIAGNNPLMSFADSVTSVVASPLAGIQGLGEDIRHMVSSDDEKPLPVNQMNRSLANFNQSVREGVSDKIDNKVWNFIYNAGMSTADSAAAIGIGLATGGSGALGSAVTQGLMSVGAADNTYNEAIERGIDPGRAMATGILAGVTEWVTEKYSIDGLKSLALKRPDNIRTLVKNIGKQMATEGSEEAASDVMNTIVDNVVNGKKSEFNLSVKRYKEQGLDSKQAKKAAMMDWLGNTVQDAAAGAVSGFLMGAGGSVASYRNNQNSMKQYGENIDKIGDKEGVIEYAKRFDDLAESATEVENKVGKKSDKNTGFLADALDTKLSEVIDSAESATQLQDAYNELSENAPQSVQTMIDEKVSNKARELSNGAKSGEARLLNRVADMAEESYNANMDEIRSKLDDTEDFANEESTEEAPALKAVGVDTTAESFNESEGSVEGVANETTLESDLRGQKVAPKVFNNTAARLEASGEPVKIDGFENIGTGNAKIKIDGNDAVDLDDLDFDNSSVKSLYRSAVKMDDAAAASAMISNYDTRMSVSKYYNEFEKAYNWGSVGYNYNDMVSRNIFTIPEHVIRQAYMLGENKSKENFKEDLKRSTENREGKKKFKKGEGKVTDERRDAEDLEKGVYEHIDEKLAKKLGINIREVDQAHKDINERINGFLDINNAEMVFSDAAESEFGVRIHESLELAEAISPAEYRILMNRVLNYALRDNNTDDDIYDTIMNYRAAYRGAEGSKTFAEAADEYLNDAISSVFMNEEGAREFIAWLNGEDISEAEKKGILKSILEIIDKLIEKLTNAFKNESLTKAQKQASKIELEKMKSIRELFFATLDQTASVYKDNSSDNTEVQDKAASAKVYSVAVDADVSEDAIKKNMSIVAEMEPAASINGTKIQEYGEKKSDQIINYFNSVGNLARSRYGEINLGNKSRKSIIAHNPNFVKMAAIPTIKEVLEKGYMCQYLKDYDAKGVDRGLIVAPIAIDNIKKSGEYLMGVSVKFTPSDNRMYIHELILLDANGESVGAVANPAPQASGTTDSPSIISVLLDIYNVKQNSRKKETKTLKKEGVEVRDMSKEQIDSAYAAAVKNKDEKAQAELVREAAKRAGYDSPMLYHGTQDFGFTEFNLDKMDDGRSIFTTDSKELASTYSGRLAVRRIESNTKKAREIYENGTKEEKLRFIQEHYGEKYRYASREDIRSSMFSERRQISELFDTLFENEIKDEELDDTFSKWVKSAEGQKFTRAIEKFAVWDADPNFVSPEELTKSQEIIEEVINSESVPSEVKKYLDTYGTYNIDRMTYYIASTVNEDISNYVSDDDTLGVHNISQLFFRKPLDNAIYRLYGKTDGMLEFDAHNQNWNRMFAGASWEGTALSEHFGSNDFKTRDLAEFAKDNGYSGVIIKNVIDDGGRRYEKEAEKPQTIRIFFNPSDVKSADNITYDENGEVIPLSERFNDEEKDIRYSLNVDLIEKDSEGREITPEQQEFFKDSKIVDEEGNLKVVYHGSMNDFTIFDINQARGTEDIEAFFFSGDREEAEGYGDENLKEYYLNITNPADYDTAYDVFFKHKGETGAGRIAREELEKMGYDGVIAYDEDAPEYTEYLAFRPEQIKLVDNETPTNNPDIRFSAATPTESSDLIRENAQLKEMVEKLQQEFEITGGTKPNPATIKRVANKVLRQYNSSYDVNELVNDITSIYSYLRSENADGEVALKKMSEVAQAILDKGGDVVDNYAELRDYFKKTAITFTDEQKSEIANAFESFGAFRNSLMGKVKISNKGTSLEDAWNSDLRHIAPELFSQDVSAEEMPLILADVIDAIQPRVIAYGNESAEQGAYDLAMQIYTELAKVKPMQTFADKQAAKFYEAMRNVSEGYEKMLEEYRKQIAEDNEEDLQAAAEEFRDEKRRRIAQNQSEMKALLEGKKNAKNPKTLADYEKRFKRLEAENARLKKLKDEEVARIRAKYNNRRHADMERRKSTETKNKIRKLHDRFSRMILKPTETMYVPKDLMSAAVAVCNVVNPGYGEGTKLRKALDEARRSFPKVSKEDGILASDFDPRIESEIDELAKIFDEKPEGWSIKDASLEELNRIYDAMNGVYECIRMSTKLIREEGEKDARKAGLKWMEEIRESKGLKNVLGKSLDKITSSFLNSRREFRKISGYNDDGEIMETWKELNHGQRDMFDAQLEASNLLNDAYGDSKAVTKMLSKLDSDLVKVPLKFESGNAPVMVTRGMRLSLIMHGQSQANMRHMMLGGVDIPANLKTKDKKKRYETMRKVKGINYEAIRQMEMQLTSEERVILDAMKKLFWEWSGEKINETSNKLYGFERARVKNYFPITVNKDYVAADISALKFDKTIEGAGFLKERVTSNNPIILDNILDVAEKTIHSTSLFYGLAIPIRNFNKIINTGSYELSEADGDDASKVLNTTNDKKLYYVPTDSVKQALREKWGMTARNYIDNLVADLQQARSKDFTWYDRLRGNYASAVLTANASVIIKQTSAYPTVAAITGWGPTVKAMLRGGIHNHPLSKADVELINKYTPLYWYRNQGNNSRDFAEIRDMDSAINKIPPVKFAKDLIQKVDMAMVGRFWYAAQYYVDSNYKNLAAGKNGTEEQKDAYYRKVAEVFDRAVEETQSTNMVMQNADIMRNPNGAMKMITMFMGQGLQNFGIVYDNLANMRAKEKQFKEGKCTKEVLSRARKDFANALTSQLVSAAMFAGLAVVARALLHRMNPYRDDKEEVTAESIAKRFSEDMLENIIGSVPFGSLIYETVNGLASNKGAYGVYGQQDVVLESLNDLEKSFQKLGKSIASGENIPASLNQFLKDGSKVIGIPYENVWNLGEGIFKHVQDVVNGDGFLSFSSDQKDPKAKVIAGYLNEAIVNKDKYSQEKYCGLLYELGKSDKQINGLLAQMIQGDEAIVNAANDKVNGKFDSYESIIKEYKEKGYPKAAVSKAIDKIVKDMTGEKEEKEEKEDIDPDKIREISGSYMKSLDSDVKLYKNNDLVSAVESGKYANVLKKLYDEKVKEQTDKGLSKEEAKKKARSNIKTALSREYHGKYLDKGLTTHQRQQIVNKLSKIKVDGTPVYNQKDFERWFKELKKA